MALRTQSGGFPKELVSSVIRVAVYGPASLAQQAGKLVRRRFNALISEQLQICQEAKAAIESKVAKLR